MRDTKACLACLNTDDRLERIPESWYRIFNSLTGVQVSKNDGYPNNFCVECKSYIQKAIAFRRKSRRAFFLLKEIMTVRKEVNLSDIRTVNRSSANLKSSLDLWKPERSALYTISNNDEESPILERQDITMVNNGAVIDIKGEVGECSEENEEENQLPLEDDHVDQPDEVLEEEAKDTDVKERQIEEEEIDMEDIFKGLKEPQSEAESEEVEIEIKRRGKEVEKKEYSAICKGRALTYFEIKQLSEEEQRVAFRSRIANPIFRQALYNCGICVKVMPSAEVLMKHFDGHMKKSAAAYLCKICKDKFTTSEDLDIHNHETHMYQYMCKICQDVSYTVRDMVKHKKEKHVQRYQASPHDNLIDYEAQLYDNFQLIPILEGEKEEFFRTTLGMGKYNCDVCSLSLPSATLRDRHREQHRRKPVNLEHTLRKQCPLCGVWCVTADLYNKHTNVYHDYNYICKMCPYEAPNKEMAQDHLLRVHRKLTNACRICGFYTSSAVGLLYHMNLQHAAAVRNKYCVLCGLGFASHASLYSHQFREHKYFKLAQPPPEGAENACKPCNLHFMSQKAYYMHLVKAQHEEAEIVPWKCLPCRKMFDSEAEYREHSVGKCKIKYPASCHLCDEIVTSYKRHYLHCLKKHNHDMLNRGKLCHVCGKKYTVKAWANHECLTKNYAKYKCSICDVVFHKPLSVVFHVLQKHAEKPFSCNICNETFRRRHDCKNHILKIHMPVQPYACPICQKEFSHIDYLKKHGREMHYVKIELDVKVKKKKFLYLYPDMKVDLRLIDKRIIDELRIRVADYTDQVFEPIQNYSGYVITNADRQQGDCVVKYSRDFVISGDALKKKQQQEENKKMLIFNEEMDSPTTSRHLKAEDHTYPLRHLNMTQLGIEEDILRSGRGRKRKRSTGDREQNYTSRQKKKPTSALPRQRLYNISTIDMDEDQDGDYAAQALDRKPPEQGRENPFLDEEARNKDRPTTSALSRHYMYKPARKKSKSMLQEEE